VKYNLKKVIRDGKEIWLLQCPACKQWASIDDDQFNGRVSTQCECGGFHETVNFNELLKKGFVDSGEAASKQESA